MAAPALRPRRLRRHRLRELARATSVGRGGDRAADFGPRERHDDTITAEELEARLDDPRLLVLDARLPERYRGEPNPVDRVPGHIPGARNAPYTGALPKEALEAEEVAVYCGSGVTATVQLLNLVRAGRSDAKLYPGSWSEWEHLDLPVEKA